MTETLTKESPGDVERQLSQAFLRLIGREPDRDERAILVRMFTQQQTWYRDHPDAAAEYLTIGEHKVDNQLSPIDLAAATNVINGLMNYDGCVVKRGGMFDG